MEVIYIIQIVLLLMSIPPLVACLYMVYQSRAALNGLALAAQLLPAGTFQIAYNGLILGLAASGLYDLATLATSRSTPAAK